MSQPLTDLLPGDLLRDHNPAAVSGALDNACSTRLIVEPPEVFTFGTLSS
jgi:hypothetical protein